MSSQFNIRFGLEPDPDHGQGATNAESASWGSLKILIGEVNLCRHVSGTEVRDRVNWYLLPILEWFVRNWDSLLHEIQLPGLRNISSARESSSKVEPWNLDEATGEAMFNWRQRHALRASVPGALLPDLFIRRIRNSIEFSWGNAGLPGVPSDVSFLAGRKRELLDPRQTADTLHEAIRTVITTIKAKVPGDERVERLAEAHTLLRLPRESRAAWMMGWPVAKFNRWQESLSAGLKLVMLSAPESLVISRPTTAIAMYGSLSPDISEGDVENLTRLLELRVNGGPGAEFNTMEFEAISSKSWDQGYELASHARESLNLGDERIDPAAILEDLGVKRQEIELSDAKVRAVAICGDGLQPVVAINQSCINNKSDQGLRFTLAHELCHLLIDREIGVPLAVASGPWAPIDIEQRANAFASEFLLPTGWARRLFDENSAAGVLDKAGVIAISQAAGLGKVATLRHLENIGMLDSGEAVALEEELAY